MNKKGLIFIVIVVALILVIFLCSMFLKKKEQKDRNYELLNVTEYIYYPLEVSGKYGVIKKDGTIIIEPAFDEVQIPNQDKDIFVLKSGDTYRVANEKNEDMFTGISNVSAIDGTSDYGGRVYNNTVLKYKENNKFGLLSLSGEKITKPLYDEMQSLEDKYGEILVKKDGKYGVINVKGIMLVGCKYDYIKGDAYSKDGSYKNSGYIVGNKSSSGMLYGYIDKDEKEVIKLEQETIYRVTEINSDDVYVVASLNGRYAIYKNKENLTGYKYISVFYNNGANTFTVQKNKSYGVVNLEGKVVVPEQYDELMVVGAFIKASKDGENYTFDLSGNRIEHPKFASLQETTTGKYYISINDDYKYGLCEKDRTVIIENKYDYIDEVENTGLLIATIGTEVTIYSASGKEIVSVERAELSFVGNYIEVEAAEEMYYLTVDGKKVDNKTVYLENQLYASKENGKWGFVDLKDNVIVDYQYDEITEVNQYGFAGVKKDGKWGVINKNGEVILEPTYESEALNPVFIGKYCLKNGIVRDYI